MTEKYKALEYWIWDAACYSRRARRCEPFRNLLHKLMTAQMRVTEVDMSELGLVPADGEPDATEADIAAISGRC